MDDLVPHPPKGLAKKPAGGGGRRRSISSSRPSLNSKSGMYSSGMYPKGMKPGSHAVGGDRYGAGGAGARAHQAKIFDENGNDVTPLPLLPNVKGHKNAGSYSMIGEKSESATDFLNNLESSTMASQFSSSQFGRSGYGSKASNNNNASVNVDRDDDDTSSMASAESDLDEDENERRALEKPVRHWTEAELAAPVSILLSETETMWLLEIPGVAVAADSSEEPGVRAANERYAALKASRQTNGNFVDRATQTLNYFKKSKDVQATVLKQANAECMVNDWSIYDTFAATEGKTVTDVEGAEGGNAGNGDENGHAVGANGNADFNMSEDYIAGDNHATMSSVISRSTLQSTQNESFM